MDLSDLMLFDLLLVSVSPAFHTQVSSSVVSDPFCQHDHKSSIASVQDFPFTNPFLQRLAHEASHKKITTKSRMSDMVFEIVDIRYFLGVRKSVPFAKCSFVNWEKTTTTTVLFKPHFSTVVISDCAFFFLSLLVLF